MELKRPTYFHVTAEVVCSFEMVKDPLGYPYQCTFQLGGVSRRWTSEDFNELFEMPLGISRLENGAFNANRFWREITGEIGDYKIRQARASSIKNPVLRYTDRVLSNTLFARSEGSVVSRGELYALWCMLNGVQFNVGAYFIAQLHRFRTIGF